MDNRYNRHNRCKYSLKVYIVLVTKYRKQILKGSIADDVKQKIYDICNSKGYDVIAMETDKEHNTLRAKVNGYKFTRLLPPPKGSGFPPMTTEKGFYL